MFDLRIPLDGWLCVWSCGYECNSKLIENPDEAVDYFTEDIGFSDEDIRDILHLKEGESWAMNGLQIFKMNRRVDGMMQLRDLAEELSKETDRFDPVEINDFIFWHGYYSCKSELGLSISDNNYDKTKLEEFRKIYFELNKDKFRR